MPFLTPGYTPNFPTIWSPRRPLDRYLGEPPCPPFPQSRLAAGETNEGDIIQGQWKGTPSPGPATKLTFAVAEVLATQHRVGIHAHVDSAIHTW